MREAWKPLVDWIEIPSVTGAEGEYADAVARHLGGLGFGVERQELAPGRFNLLARTGVPEVVFCTHLDTVPPWFGARVEGGRVHGRGACDAKGPLLAMIAAARALLEEEREDRVGFLLTVGEEIDSVGAALANERLAEPWRPRATIVGEPTGNRYVSAHKGVYKATLVARGVAGHSSQPGGPSAIHELVACAHRLLGERWGEHPVLGPGTLNVGTIEGGVAANVYAPSARAELLLRAVEPPEATERRIRACLSPHVELCEPLKGYGPTEFLVPPGHEGVPVAFGTDAPHLRRWGTPLLYGPGRIADAHTAHEHIELASLEEAAVEYRRVARELLAAAEVPR